MNPEIEKLKEKMSKLENRLNSIESGMFSNIGEEQIRNIIIDRLQSTNAESLSGYFMVRYKGKIYKVAHYGN